MSDETEIILEIFDFDGTLFANPFPTKEMWPKGVFGKLNFQWYQQPETLAMPWIPENPGLEWWNACMLKRARMVAKDRPNTIPIVMTGRRRALFEQQVVRLLKTQGLLDGVFLAVILKPEGKTTFQYKVESIQRQMENFGATKVKMWDDRYKHVKRFNAWFEEQGIDGECG